LEKKIKFEEKNKKNIISISMDLTIKNIYRKKEVKNNG